MPPTVLATLRLLDDKPSSMCISRTTVLCRNKETDGVHLVVDNMKSR